MKQRKTAVLLVAALCLGLLTGCTSPQKQIQKIQGISNEARTEKDWVKLANAYAEEDATYQLSEMLLDAENYYPESEELQALMDKYLLPAPVPSKKPGSYDGALRLHFDGEVNRRGTLYLTVDHDEPFEELQEDTSIPDDGIQIREEPDEHGFKIDLYTPGTHTVRAFLVENGQLISRPFEGKYTLTGAEFSGFTFSQPAGEYKAPMKLDFEGTEGGSVYYTLDGSDPLFVGDGGGAVLDVTSGTLVEGPLPLLAGTRSVTARCITENGLVSPLISAEYQMKMIFDSSSNAVGEDQRFELVGTEGNGLLCYDRQFGGDLKTIHNKKVRGISVFQYETTQMELQGIDENSEVLSGWAFEQLTQPVTATQIYIRPTIGDNTVVTYVDGERQNAEVWYGPTIRNIGGCWMQFDNEAIEIKGATPIGTKEVAGKVTLLTEQIALWADSGEVWACDPDGGNERMLWAELEGSVWLDAVTEKVLLYHVGDKHMVYDLSTGEHRGNSAVADGTELLGYTSGAAYIYKNGSLTRREVDFTKL